MKTSRLVLAPAVAIALTGLAAAPAFAATSQPTTLPSGPLCAYDDASPSTGADDAVPDKSTPQATVSAAQVTRAEIIDSKKGIGFSGTGFTADNKATVTVVGTEGTKYTPPTKLTVDEDGQVSGTYFFTATEDAQVPVGTYTLYLTDLKTEKISSKVTFEVVATEKDKDATAKDPECENPVAPAPSPSASETTPETTPATPTTPATKPPASKAPAAPPAPASPTETAPASTPSETSPAPTPTESTTPESTAPTTESAPPKAPAKEAPETKDPATTETPATKSPEAAPTSPGADVREPVTTQAASMVISPTEISSEDFLNTGVKIGITGAKAGEEVTITVEQAQGRVDRYSMTKKADADGTVTFGVQAKVKAVLGTYNVRAQAASFDKPQGGSFTVVTNGTSVSSDDSSSSNDLPRTGAEMTGLALGAGLLVVGAAAVIITRRRTRAGDDPAEL